MVMKSFQKCKKAYVFSILAACLFLVVSLAFALPVETCKHCGNRSACKNGDPNTQQGWENCLTFYDEFEEEWYCGVWGEFGDCEMS